MARKWKNVLNILKPLNRGRSGIAQDNALRTPSIYIAKMIQNKTVNIFLSTN